MGNQNREIGRRGEKRDEEEEEEVESVLAAHRHLFAKELRGNFVSVDSGSVPLELSAS